MFHCSVTLTEKVLPDVQIEPPLLHFVLIVSRVGMRHHWFCPVCTLLQVFIHVGKIPLSFLFSRINSPRSLSCFLIGEVLQPLYHLCAPYLDSVQYLHVTFILERTTGEASPVLRRIISLDLLAVLLLIQPRLSLTLSSKDMLFMVNLMSAWAPRTFAAKQLSS